ncbi:MAG TPA: lysylphosphatidylglycerol synthase transmembrane domain-containing protein [Gaiellaceae bacterium]|nr:lysylphosphatidylglycerol synthase transmembrane domain-containing protein [Gaiellaceae bacterium]
MRGRVRLAATLVVSALAVGYILLKIDVRKTLEIIGNASPAWVALSAFLILITIVPMVWRWQQLLRARGIDESFSWLNRAYFVSYAVGQVLPTSVGGDASRIYETARRHPGQISPITGSVLLERALGGAVTLFLAGVGFLLAIGRYDIGAYLWIELLFIVGTILAGVVFFSRRVRRHLGFAVPLARRLRVERILRTVYEGVHGYRDHLGTLALVVLATLIVQIGRILSIYAAGRAVGIGLSPLPYIVLGPLLFLVMLVPFTINGLAVREAFFVSFLGKLGVPPDEAFACGFLFFLLTLVLSLPGLAVLLWEGVRRAPPVPDGSS